jgi:hypothetical protein
VQPTPSSLLASENAYAERRGSALQGRREGCHRCFKGVDAEVRGRVGTLRQLGGSGALDLEREGIEDYGTAPG